MRHLHVVAVAAAAMAIGAAPSASAQEKCFDKGTLSYVDCPQPAPAPAAPPPVVETYPSNWTGWYLGAHAGYAWADVEGAYLTLDFDDLDVDGFLAGGQLGYLYQYDNNIVVGLEIDGSAVFADDSQDAASAIATTQRGLNRRIEAELDWLASARLRVGYAADEFLPYLTGGVALAGWSAEGSDAAAAFSLDDTAFGGVVGGGVEYMFDDNWTAGAEGLYYLFSTDEEDLSPVGFAGDSVSLDDVIVARFRLNYRF